MSNIYNHSSILPSGTNSRISELLEALKNEFDAISQDVTMFKVQREELEHKLSAQLSDLNSFQKNFIDLENAHLHLKRQYEEEILRLKKELERSSQGSVSVSHTLPPPNIAQSNPALFGTLTASSPRVDESPNVHGRVNQINQNNSNANSQTLHSISQTNNAHAINTKRLRSDPDLAHLPSIQNSANNNNNNIGSQSSMYRGPPSNNQTSFGHSNGYANKLKNTKNTLPPTQTYKDSPSATINQRKQSSVTSSTAVSAAPAPPRPPAIQQTVGPIITPGFADVKVDKVPANLKREGTDWFAIFNPKYPMSLNLDMVSNFEHSSVVCCVKFSNDGKFLATGCNRSAQIFDVDTFQKVCQLIDDTVDQNEDLYIRSICFSPDGKYLATGAEDKLIRIWDISKKKIKQYFHGHELDIYSLDFSADGKTLVSGSGDRTARIWDMETGKSIFTLSIEDVGARDAGVTSVAISPDGRLLVGGSLDRFIRIWDIKTGYLLDRLEGHVDSVYSVAFSPDGKYLVSGALDRTLKLWEVGRYLKNESKSSTVCCATLAGHKDFVLSVACSRCGNWIVSGSKDRGVQFWDPRTQNAHVMLQGHKNSVISVALNSKRNIFATGSGDFRARLWSYESLNQN